MILRAPLSYFGAKWRVSPDVWARFGNPPNFVEPFCGSAAILLGRPGAPGNETINDFGGLVVNFWRSLKYEHEKVVEWAGAIPCISEIDLHSRHKWVIERKEGLAEELEADPFYCDPPLAGWWVYGMCAQLGGEFGTKFNRSIPKSSREGIFSDRGENLLEYFAALADRLKSVRVCCGDWERVVQPSSTIHCGRPTAIFLDPPYEGDFNQEYETQTDGAAGRCKTWAIENGDNPDLRIALCGYIRYLEDMPKNWEIFRWKATGGYGNTGEAEASKQNATEEAICFSPHCLRVENQLFGEDAC